MRGVTTLRSLTANLALFALLTLSVGQALAGQLVVHFMISSGVQRTAWVSMVDRFAAANPDIQVINREWPQETYKAEFEATIAKEPIDIAFWFAGERLNAMAAKKLIVPIDWETVRALRAVMSKPTLDATVIDGGTYGFPLSYYPWGFFYRKPLFDQLGIAVPTSKDDFRRISQRLKDAGIAPFAVGAINGWPAAAWFDYLNLRLNGIAFHQKLLSGEIPFSDPRVKAVFVEWKDLLNKGFFHEPSMALDWDGVFPYLYRDQVGMVLMGGFAGAKIPANIKKEIGFFPFPHQVSKVPMTEEAPLDVLVLPAKGKNHRDAHRFLKFLAKPANLNAYNESVNQISPLKQVPLSKDAFMNSQRAILDQAASLTFFFDRDANAALVKPVFNGIRAFLNPPHDVDAALHQIQVEIAAAKGL